MEYKGSSAYDVDAFFQQFMKRRYRTDSPNLSIEKPAFLELAGDLKGCSVLDLGCGDASLGLDLLNQGCASYLGIEGSDNMYKEAIQVLHAGKGKIEYSLMEDYAYPPETFDLVVSQLAIHYVEDIETLFQSICRTLKPGGRLVFSVQHPLLTSSFTSSESGKSRSSWIVDDYFYSGKRIENWMGEQVVKYHRTTGEYFSALAHAEFKIESLTEPKPERENFTDPEEYKRRMRIPLFLLFSCTKGGD